MKRGHVEHGWLGCIKCQISGRRRTRWIVVKEKENKYISQGWHPKAIEWHDRIYNEMYLDYIKTNVDNMETK